MYNFDIIWKFAVLSFLFSCLVVLGQIQKSVKTTNEAIIKYFSPIEDIPLPVWEEN